MIIRKATLDDIKIVQNLNYELYQLEQKCYDEHLSDNWSLSEKGRKFFETAIKNKLVYVAVVDLEVVGYIHFDIINMTYYDFDICEICDICVSEKFRRKGIGKLLCEAVFEDCKKRDINHFSVTASFKNESAISFYKKLGFENLNLTLVKF